MKRMTRWLALLALLAGPMAAFAQTTTTSTTTLPNPNVQLKTLPSCAGGACVPALDPVLKQLRSPKLYSVATAGGITATVNASKTLSDGTNNTLVFFALIGGQEGNNLRVSTTRTGTATFTVTIKRLTVTLETFNGLSMANSNAQWVAKVINDGITGVGPSRYVRVVDLDAVESDARPSNVTDQAFTSGANEFTVTGVRRGDYVAAATLADASAAQVATDFAVSTDDKMVTKTTIAGSKVLLLLVYPGS